MKHILMVALFVTAAISLRAQTQKNWYIIGGQLSNLSLNFQKDNTQFGLDLTPRVGWFVKDNLAVGAELLIGLNTAKGYTQFDYGVGPIARYYFTRGAVTTPAKTRIFADGNVGFYGQNVKTTGSPSTSTNGLGIGIGPGIAYFFHPNIALEALLKYNWNVGFGNSATNNSLNLGLGFQIHLPRARLVAIKNEMKNP